MVTVTFEIDSETLQAARIQAERRNTSIEEMVLEYIANLAHAGPTEEDNKRLIELIHSSPLGDLGKLPTREEIYAERT